MNSKRQITVQNQTDSQPSSPEADFSSTVKVHGETPPTNVYEVEAKPTVDTGAKTERQPEQSPPQPPQEERSNSSNSPMGRLLMGGLVGATLGTLAAALANRKTSRGFNHSAQGVGRALKTIGQGLGQAAQGVGDAAKSVGEGATYAVVGSALEIKEGTQQLKSTTTGVVYSATDKVNQAVKGAAADLTEGAQQVKATAAEAVQSTTEQINQAVKDIAEGAGETVEESVLAEDQAIAGSAAEVAAILVVEEPVLEMGDGLDVIEAEVEMQDDVVNSTSSGDFVTEEITISSQPYVYPEVEAVQPNDESRKK